MQRKNTEAAAASNGHKRSLLGLLFNPQLGPGITPLRDSARIFIHLIAAVFSLYGLFPKNHPALKDENARLTLREVIGTAWNNIEFTREGAPRTIIFFAVTGIMAFSGCAALITLFSFFMGQAHAQTMANSSAFAPESQDLAQSWLEYLFNNGTYPNGSDSYGSVTAYVQSPFTGGALQSALITTLAFYSNAILIVAAMILFYHLTAMIVETAHHGQAMGKRASQVWAPIRLVVAIGLLVPVNGGLSCGQFIVIKMAELGSGMASQAWDTFLQQLVNYQTQSVPPAAPFVDKIVNDLVKMKACETAWNLRVKAQQATNVDISGSIMQDPQGFPFTLGNMAGTKYSYSSNAVTDKDVCGWYFVPSYQGADQVTTAAAQIQNTALSAAQGAITTAANDITPIVNVALNQGNTSGTTTAVTQIQLNNHIQAAVSAYEQSLSTGMAGLTNNDGSVSQALSNMKKYGWVMAGAFLNTISRLQGELSDAAASTLPTTHAPDDQIINDKDKPSGFLARLKQVFIGADNDEAWNVRKGVSSDMHYFDLLIQASINNPSSSASGGSGTNNSAAQCASMIGFAAADASGSGNWFGGSGAADMLFGLVDRLASWNGVWQSGTQGSSCAGAPNSPQTFSLGIQINNQDPFAQMAHLGHANLDVAFGLVELGLGSSLLSAAASLIPTVGDGISKIINGASGLLFFLAFLFFAAGFTLAYLLPLMPFMHFFFAVLSWIAAVIEAVIAIPLVALAHLNPEGEGLPGQSARNAYFFVFNLFLRPVLTVFGLICGLIVFLIAISFLNYGYAIAVAGAGGTAYGQAAMSKVIYSILYVAIVYICANHSFQLINHLPQHAMSWMGASGQQMPNMGDAGKFENIASGVSAYAGQQGIQAVKGAASDIGGGVASLGSAAIGKESSTDQYLKQILEELKGGPPKLTGGEPGGNNRNLPSISDRSQGDDPSGGGGGGGGAQSAALVAGRADGGDQGQQGNPSGGGGGAAQSATFVAGQANGGDQGRQQDQQGQSPSNTNAGRQMAADDHRGAFDAMGGKIETVSNKTDALAARMNTVTKT